MVTDQRIPVVLVAGLAEPAAAAAVDALLLDQDGTVVIRHDLRRLAEGVIHRRVRQRRPGSDHHDRTTLLELAHGCVSCTLREDLLPLLAHFGGQPDTVSRVVLHLDPALEPEAVCWAIEHALLADGHTAAERVRIEAVVTAVDLATWLADATGDATLAERGLGAAVDDERTVAQVAVGQVEFADALVLTATGGDAWTAARTRAVLDRLAPAAVHIEQSTPDTDRLDVAGLLARVPAAARRGRVDDAHGPLLRGEPPLEPDCGVALTVFRDRRPFHPQRLYRAMDVLLDGVVRTRGRVWLASQPDVALWLDSAGGGLRVGHAGPWLAALPDADWAGVDPERRAMAALSWDPYFGDRTQELAVLSHLAEPEEITAALRAALLTDDELGAGQQEWSRYPDPFGDWRDTGHAPRPDPVAGTSSDNRKDQT